MDIKIRFYLSSCRICYWSRSDMEVPVHDWYVRWRSILFYFHYFYNLHRIPILLAEFLIGRGSQKDAVSAYAFFTPRSGWPAIGILGMITCFILLSFYSVVG